MWAFVAEKYGDKLVINITIIIYIILILYSFNLSDGIEFYILAGLIGFIQGGIQGSSRSLFAKLIPSDKAGAFFGLLDPATRRHRTARILQNTHKDGVDAYTA